MSQRAKDLSKRTESFRDEVIAFVAALSAEEWNAPCEWEEWTTGVTARHIGAGHFRIFELAGMIIEGKELGRRNLSPRIYETAEEARRVKAD